MNTLYIWSLFLYMHSYLIHQTFVLLMLGSSFLRLIPDKNITDSTHVKRLVFCSGKIYYELVKQMKVCDLDDCIAISRIEQVHVHGKIL